MADVQRAKREVSEDAIHFAMVIFFSVMMDKEGYGTRVRLPRLWRQVKDRIACIRSGYASVADYEKTMNERGMYLE